MAKYEGLFELSGKLGNSIFVNKGASSHVKSKPLLVKLSEGSKKSATDFGEASRSANRIRKALAPLIEGYGDKTLINRLNKRMIAAFQAIPNAQSGTRAFEDSHFNLLVDFSFNPTKSIHDLWINIPEINLQPEGVALQLDPVEFSKSIPPKASKFVVQLLVANLDLIGSDNEIIKSKDLILPINRVMKPLKLTIPLNLTGERVLCVAIGIHFLGSQVKMANKKYYACDICYAERIKNGGVIKFLVTPPAVTFSPNQGEEGVAWELL